MEIAHQIRLRNLSGIILVDFIDMEPGAEPGDSAQSPVGGRVHGSGKDGGGGYDKIKPGGNDAQKGAPSPA